MSQTRRKLEEEIREREQAEKKVQGSAKLLRDALNAVSDGIWEWNVQSGEVKLDTRSKELFGFDQEKENLDAADIFRGIDSASVPGVIKDIQDHTEGRTDHYDHEFQVNLPDGKVRWIRGRGRVIDRDSDRNAVWVIGTNVDITERKLAEQERLKTETRFRELIEKVAEIGIQGYDEDRKVIFWNKASEELYGYTEEEALGHRLENLIIPDFMREDVVRLHHEWVAGGVEIPAGELVLIGKSGEDIPVFSSHVMQETSSGKVMYCIDVDLRPLQRAEQRRQELEEQLRQVYKMEAIGTMAGGIAHDFNNSLAIILGNVELSALKVPEDSQVAGHLQQAKTAILRARDLVQQILIYSRQGVQNFKPVQISMILDEAFKLMRSTIPSTVELKFSVPEECQDLNISADSTQLQQILINLCNNAVHAMEEKGRLEVSLESVALEADALPVGRNLPVGPYVKLRVEDSGKGMPVEILGKVFDPFFTTKGVGEGTGMGLSVVHGIVESHGGFITAESTVGAGSVFEVFFPIVHVDGFASLPVVDALPKGNERIIFVDDDETLVDVGRQMLAEHGYRVTAETSSRHALELFQLNPDQFDLVITDQTMPGLTGTELAEELLKIKPDLPIIICTGYSARVSADEAKQIGIREFCMKPLNLSQLIQTTRKTLDAAVQKSN